MRARPISLVLRHFTKSRNVLEKTPFQVFTETFSQELKKSKELQTNWRALQDETGRLQESTAFKRAREALEHSRKARSATLNKANELVYDSLSNTWNSQPLKFTREKMNTAADQVEKMSEPLRKSQYFQEIKNVVDDGASVRYGHFENKEQRHKRRELELERLAKVQVQRIKADERAGQSLVVHETAEPDKDSVLSGLYPVLEKMRIWYEESDNGLISVFRQFTDLLSSFFAETETAQVVKKFKEMDPNFTVDGFLKELRTFILPEILDANARGDTATLKQWLSEASFNVYQQLSKEYTEKGLYAAGRVLDIRGVDIVQAKIGQPDNRPMYIVACRVQETQVYKSLKTDEVEAGVQDQVLLTPYVMVVSRLPDELDNKETRGFKILELVRGRSTEYI